MAKRIIHLAVKVGEKINKDPDTKDLLRCYFLPDYNVSLAEVIIPGNGHREAAGYWQRRAVLRHHALNQLTYRFH